MAANRKQIREQLAQLLRNEVPDVVTVHAAEPGDLGHASPVIVVSSRGSERTQLTFQGSQLRALLSIDVYTLAATGDDYDDETVSALIDDIEASIATLVDSFQNLAPWEAFDYDGASSIEFGLFGADGVPRWRERIPVAIVVFQ